MHLKNNQTCTCRNVKPWMLAWQCNYYLVRPWQTVNRNNKFPSRSSYLRKSLPGSSKSQGAVYQQRKWKTPLLARLDHLEFFLFRRNVFSGGNEGHERRPLEGNLWGFLVLSIFVFHGFRDKIAFIPEYFLYNKNNIINMVGSLIKLLSDLPFIIHKHKKKHQN